MKKLLLYLIAGLGLAAGIAAETATPVTAAQDAAVNTAKKKVFMQVGAVEKTENDKYTMRKTETRYEFYIDDNTKIFLREETTASALREKNYVVIKGPKNKKVVLANSIYIYNNREDYESFSEKKEETPEAVQKVFSTLLEGRVKQLNPLIITLADGTEYTVSYDEDTYWILTSNSGKDEIKAGERIKLFFDKLYSIRYKNFPIKIVIDRVKAGF